MANHAMMKLGKKPALHDPRVKAFARYADALPPPKSVNWLGDQTDFGMMCNDRLGDCTIASKGHGIQVVTKNVRGEFTPSDASILHYYELWDGYNPADPSTDQGGIISDVLAKAKAQTFCGRHLGGYCTVDPKNDVHIDQAINLFCHLDVGVNLPTSAQTQDVWDIPDGQDLTGDWAPGSWGGHDISIHAVAAPGGDLTCVTWGAPKRITRRWFHAYCDEAYAVLWGAWIANNGMSASGFSYEALAKDMASL